MRAKRRPQCLRAGAVEGGLCGGQAVPSLTYDEAKPRKAQSHTAEASQARRPQLGGKLRPLLRGCILKGRYARLTARPARSFPPAVSFYRDRAAGARDMLVPLSLCVSSCSCSSRTRSAMLDRSVRSFATGAGGPMSGCRPGFLVRENKSISFIFTFAAGARRVDESAWLALEA